MAESPDGRGVLIFGGVSRVEYQPIMHDTILELRAGANSWKILNITLQNGRVDHTVIPLRDFF